MYFIVLEGAQKGAIVNLDVNHRYTLSNDWNSDIYIESEEPYSLEFKICGELVSVSAASGKVINYISKQTFANKEFDLPLIIEVSSCVCAITLDKNLDLISTVHLINSESNQKSEHDNQTKEAESFASNLDRARLSLDKESIISISWLRQKVLMIFAPLKNLLIRIWVMVYTKFGKFVYLGIIFVILFSCLILISLSSIRRESQLENNSSELWANKTKLNQVLVGLPSQFSNVKLDSKNGQLVLNGIVENKALLTDIAFRFRKFHYQNRIMAFNAIEPKILNIMTQDKIVNPKLSFNPSIGIIASGITDNIENINSLEIDIANQVGDLGVINVSNIYISNDIDTFILQNTESITDQVKITKNYSVGIVSITGYLTSSQISSLNESIRQFNDSHNGVINIKLSANDIFQAIPFSVEEVYSGNSPWIITDDGTKLYPGSTYKGITIIAIDSNAVTFKTSFIFKVSLDDLNNLIKKKGTVSSSPVAEANCIDRSCLIQEEKHQELDTLSKERQQVHDLELILKNTKNQNLQDALVRTMANLNQDLELRTREYNAYLKVSS